MIEDPVIIEGKEYKFADMPAEAQKMIQYITSVDSQLDRLDVQMDQLKICREGCHARLLAALED